MGRTRPPAPDVGVTVDTAGGKNEKIVRGGRTKPPAGKTKTPAGNGEQLTFVNPEPKRTAGGSANMGAGFEANPPSRCPHRRMEFSPVWYVDTYICAWTCHEFDCPWKVRYGRDGDGGRRKRR